MVMSTGDEWYPRGVVEVVGCSQIGVDETNYKWNQLYLGVMYFGWNIKCNV